MLILCLVPKVLRKEMLKKKKKDFFIFGYIMKNMKENEI